MDFISSVIVGHNGEGFIKKCLDSLFNQKHTRFEVIYIDNASTDKSLDIAQQYPLKIIRLKKNIGFTGGCNTAIKYCNGDFILFINQDTISSPNLLSELIKHIKDDNVAIVYPHINDYREHPKISNLRCPLHFLPSIGALMFGEPANHPINVGFATGTAFMIKKTVLKNLSYLFDERLFMYYEDVDLSIRIITKGYNIKWVPTTCVWHHSENPSLQAAFLSMRNIHLVIYKNFGFSYYIRTLPWIFYQHIFIIGHFNKRHGISTRIMLAILIRAYFATARIIKCFRPVSSVKSAIEAYNNICPNKKDRKSTR